MTSLVHKPHALPFIGPLFAGIGSFLSAFGAAMAVSAAVENHRKPRAADLRALGIDPESFPKVD